jgi:hypothetical protein
MMHITDEGHPYIIVLNVSLKERSAIATLAKYTAMIPSATAKWVNRVLSRTLFTL